MPHAEIRTIAGRNGRRTSDELPTGGADGAADAKDISRDWSIRHVAAAYMAETLVVKFLTSQGRRPNQSSAVGR